MTVHDVSGRQQEAFLIDLDTLPMWLATIDVSRVAEGVRPKLIRFQKECVQVLLDHYFGKPPEDPGLVFGPTYGEAQIRLLLGPRSFICTVEMRSRDQAFRSRG
jgi:hypothetical protein